MALPLQLPPFSGYLEAVSSSSRLQRVSDIAADQWGLITRRQISDAGTPPTTLDRITASRSALQRVASGVYHLVGAPIPDHIELRAAWLQLAPDTPVWERRPDQGVVSHRSAAAVYGIGHLPADTHEFTLPKRRQTRRPDVKIHIRSLTESEWIKRNGLPVTRPSRIAADLLREHEDPEAVALIIAEAIRTQIDDPATFVAALTPHAARLGFRRADGLALLTWLLDLANAPEAERCWTKPGPPVVNQQESHERAAPLRLAGGLPSRPDRQAQRGGHVRTVDTAAASTTSRVRRTARTPLRPRRSVDHQGRHGAARS